MGASTGSEFLELDVEYDAQSSFSRPSNTDVVAMDEEELRWAAIERLPSVQRSNVAVLRRTASELRGDEGDTAIIDVRKLDRRNRELAVRKALATNAQDNYRLLSGIKD